MTVPPRDVFYVLAVTMDNQPAGELTLLEDDIELIRAQLKIAFKGRVRTSSTVRWLKVAERADPGPVGRPSTVGNIRQARLRKRGGAWQ